MTSDAPPTSETEASPNSGSRRLGLLVSAAVAVVVIPAVFGILLLRDDTGDSGNSGSDMGGGGDSIAATTGVFPLSDILDGDITVEVAADSSSAVVRLSTTIDVVCGASYGPTATLGGLATDTDMAGGGHRNHQPRLVGLQPDTEYLYRLQGVAADGRIFASELRSFSTGAGGGSATPAPNIAVGATVLDVSSEFSDSFAGANAVDGSLSTEWSSAGDGDDSFITIDLGSPAEVKGVGFRTREMSDGTSITNSFTITVDDQNTFGPFDAGPGLVVVPIEFSGQTVRFDVETSTGGNTGAVEVEVYGSFEEVIEEEEDM